MMSPTLSRSFSRGFLALMLAACSSTDASPKPAGSTATTTTRTSACQDWQHAYCDYISDRCKTLSRAECDDTVGSLFCKDDVTMQACTNALPAASCSATPASCKGVADPAPAVAYCTQFLDHACAMGERCNQGAKAACITGAGIDCSKAVGAGPSADTCLSELDDPTCPSPFALPSSCKGVIKVSGSAGAAGAGGSAGSAGSAGASAPMGGAAGAARLSPTAAGVVRAHAVGSVSD